MGEKSIERITKGSRSMENSAHEEVQRQLSELRHELLNILTLQKGAQQQFAARHEEVAGWQDWKRLEGYTELMERLLREMQLYGMAGSGQRQRGDLRALLEEVVVDYADEANRQGVALVLETAMESAVDEYDEADAAAAGKIGGLRAAALETEQKTDDTQGSNKLNCLHAASMETALTTPLLCDFQATQMKQAFYNLVKNAIEASPAGEAIFLRSGIAARGAQVYVELENAGTLEEEQLSRLLEPYYTTKEYGTGLGLPIVKRILEAHGGGLAFRCEQGRTTVRVWLPCAV